MVGSRLVLGWHYLGGNVRSGRSSGTVERDNQYHIAIFGLWIILQLSRGHFGKEEDFDLAITERSRLFWADSLHPEQACISDLFARYVPTVLKGYGSLFTHSGLHQQNIIVQEQTADSELGSMKCYIAVVVDWETTGWYPAYWEYAAAFALLWRDGDWRKSLTLGRWNLRL
ncbi:hypothetical protein GX50_02499 [[Emmonsia] crescens]|uniref:Aminoglycoside phosphotransferase domain-containing protein n=1 Tax=[Emmonsia] crescens TaxID=73230 RepID=A0A2B7ZMW2_9EURO|nr:hypothetical protein GX50_02499 [Emmonsia crescens]